MKTANRPSKSKLKQDDAKSSGKISSKIIERAAALIRATEAAEADRLAAEAERAAEVIANRMAAEASEAARAASEAARAALQEALRRSAEQAENLRRSEILIPRKTAFDPNPTHAVRAKLLEEGIVPFSNTPLLDTLETVQISGRSRRPNMVAMPGAPRPAAALPLREIQIAASQLLATAEPDRYIPEPVLALTGESKLRKINYETTSDPAPLASPGQTLAQHIEAQLALDTQGESFSFIQPEHAKASQDLLDHLPSAAPSVIAHQDQQDSFATRNASQSVVSPEPSVQASVKASVKPAAAVAQAQSILETSAPVAIAPVAELAPTTKTLRESTRQPVEQASFKTSNAILGVGISYMDQFEAHISGPLMNLWRNKFSLLAGTMHVFIPLVMAYVFAHWSLTTQALFLDGSFLSRLGSMCWLFVVCGFIWTLVFMAGARMLRSFAQDLTRFEQKGRGHLNKDR